MPTSKHLNLIVDRELNGALEAHAKQRGVNLSAAVRDLLRYGLGLVKDSRDAGWREGYNKALFETRSHLSKTMSEAINSLSSKRRG